MTEKRFIVVDDYTIVDIEEERLISTDEIVDKMNELYEENIMLKNIKKDKIIKRDYTSMGLYDNKTEKENEQLKKENKELKSILQDIGLIMTNEEVKNVRDEISSKLIKPLCGGNGVDVDVNTENGFTIIPKGVNNDRE